MLKILMTTALLLSAPLAMGQEPQSNVLPSGNATKLGVAKMNPPTEDFVLTAFGLVKNEKSGLVTKSMRGAPSGTPRRTNLLMYLKDKLDLRVRRKFYEMSQCGARAFQVIYTYYPDRKQTVSLIHPCDLTCAALVERYDFSSAVPKLESTSDPVQIDTRICRAYFYEKNMFISDEMDEE